jgi:hypothetical protein
VPRYLLLVMLLLPLLELLLLLLMQVLVLVLVLVMVLLVAWLAVTDRDSQGSPDIPGVRVVPIEAVEAVAGIKLAT